MPAPAPVGIDRARALDAIWRTGRLAMWCAAASTALGAQPSTPPAGSLTGSLTGSLDVFYALPSLIGTAPRAMSWSGDSKRVAFVWNDSGMPFGDIWAVEAAGGAPVRLTRLPHPAVDANPGPAWADQRAAIAAELDRGVASVSWTPDGARVLFSWKGELWLAGTGRDPVRLTSTPAPERGAAFAPVGNRLAYLREGDVWVSELRGDSLITLVRVTTLAREGLGVESIAWSRDGRSLAIVETDRTGIRTRAIPDYLTDETSVATVRRAMPGETSELRRLGIVDASAGVVRWLDLGPERMDLIHSLAWSPDSRSLAIDKSDVFVKDRRLLVADAATLAIREVVREREPLNVSAEWQTDWAPDGRGLYFTSDRVTDYHVWWVSASGGAPRAVTSGPWAVFGFTVTPGGLFVIGNEGRAEERQLLRVPLAGGAGVRVSARAGAHAPVVSPDGRFAADLFSSDAVPPDLYVTDLSVPRATESEERRITVSPRADVARYRWATPQYVTFPSRNDGVTLHGRLLLPPGYQPGKRYPVIMGSVYSNTVRNQWGGRNAHPLWGLDQVLLEKGYAIFAVDVAGSAGHGTAFRRRIRLDYGGVDVEDLHSGVEYLVARGIADPARIGIWGSSYGGLMTTMSLFTKPGVYKAGVAGAPATNVWHALTGEQRVMMRPQEQPAEYRKASSHTKAVGMQDHLMLVHGMRDVVVLFRDSAWLTQYLLQLGKNVELVALPDAPHGWDTESLVQTRFAFQRMLQFFDKHLGGGPR